MIKKQKILIDSPRVEQLKITCKIEMYVAE